MPTDPVDPTSPAAKPPVKDVAKAKPVDPTETRRNDGSTGEGIDAIVSRVPHATVNWVRAEYAKGAESKFATAEELVNHLHKEVGMQLHICNAVVQFVENEVLAKAEADALKAADQK